MGKTTTADPKDEILKDLEAKKLEAEIAKLASDKQKLDLDVATGQLSYEQFRQEWERNDKRRRVIRLDDVISNGPITYWHYEVDRFMAADPILPIELVINSPGGSVLDGLELYDAVLKKRAEGAVINTTVYGMAASMAGILVQAGATRRMGPNAYLMIHEVASLTLGKLSGMKDAVKFSERLYDRLIGILAQGSARAGREVLSVEQIKERADRKDWWLDASEAYQYGFVDEILAAPVV